MQIDIIKNGDEITLRPVRPGWRTFAEFEKASDDFMNSREDVVVDEGRFDFD